MQEFPRDDSGKDEGDYILEEKKSKLIADLKIALGKAETSEEKKAATALLAHFTGEQSCQGKIKDYQEILFKSNLLLDPRAETEDQRRNVDLTGWQKGQKLIEEVKQSGRQIRILLQNLF